MKLSFSRCPWGKIFSSNSFFVKCRCKSKINASSVRRPEGIMLCTFRNPNEYGFNLYLIVYNKFKLGKLSYNIILFL